MKKLISIPLYLILMYVLPLIGELELLLTIRMGILLTGAIFLLLTQPPIDPEEARQQRSTDKFTFWLILGAIAFGQITAMFEWRYFQGTGFSMWIGLASLILGIVLRFWAVQTLGKYFTATVRIQEGQRVIQAGPYAILRHPSYTGAYLAVIGSTLWLCAIWGTLIAAVVLAYAYYRRISAEEKVLVDAFGEAYLSYQKKSWRMIPGIW